MWNLARGTESVLHVQLPPSDTWCPGARAAKGGSSTKLPGGLHSPQHIYFPFLSMLLDHFALKQEFSASASSVLEAGEAQASHCTWELAIIICIPSPSLSESSTQLLLCMKDKRWPCMCSRRYAVPRAVTYSFAAEGTGPSSAT